MYSSQVTLRRKRNGGLEVTNTPRILRDQVSSSIPSMLLTPAPPWSLLGLFLCLCLLLGHADGVEVEKTQPQREILNGDIGRPMGNGQETTRRIPTLPPFLMPNRKVKSDTLPTIKKNGDLYFDLAGANETHLQIMRVGRPVRGITATSRECPVRSLLLGVSFLLDEDLFTYCPLMSLTLKGKKWRCLQEGRLLQRPGLVVHIEDASCTDAWYYNNSTYAIAYGMQEGIQKFQEFEITSCLIEMCACNWYFESDSYNMSMDCEGLGLTDDSLAKMNMLLSHVTNINFDRNNLSSMDAVIEYLMPNHEELEVLVLDNNQMTALPRLGRLFPRIIDISLANNGIEKIDLEDFEALVSRKDLLLSLEGNPFPCDSHMYHFKTIIHQLCKKGWKFCNDYFKKLTCRSEPDGEPVPLYKVSEEGDVSEVDWWLILNVTLGTLNVIMIYLILDLIMILANIRGNEERRPKMDYVVCGLKTVLCRLCPGSNAGTDKEE